EDDDMPQLSLAALAALQEFQTEKAAQEAQFEKLRAVAEQRFQAASTTATEGDEGGDKAKVPQVTMDLFTEDWQLSQFWYDDATAELLAREAHESALKSGDANPIIYFISSPSAFVKYKELYPNSDSSSDSTSPAVRVMEFDTRFSVFGPEFIHYDFNHPLEFANASELRGSASVIVADPPFLQAECLTQTCNTVKHLVGDKKNARVILCTGAVMEEKALELIGAKLTKFHPGHRGGLSNEFRCF
ncbi:hypothetical protein GQ42DRAFT_111386, partial [Ramicandelaber brevisporus]